MSPATMKHRRRVSHGGTETSHETSGPHVPLPHRSRIPWTQDETDHVKELLEYLSVQLQEENNRQLPLAESRHLMNVLQEFLNQDQLDRNDPLMSKIAYYFQEVQCLDLDKLARLLKQNQKIAKKIQDKDVILLLGQARSGKTTTLHCLAGTTFKEVVKDGFVHLQPKQFLDATVAGYEMSSQRKSVTSTLQTATVNIQDREYVVCDTPSLGIWHSAEEEIAHSHGMVEALAQARTIRPVFVLSQDCLGNRLSGFSKIFDMMTTYLDLDGNLRQGHYLPFQYVFTRFDERYRTRLWKMLNFLHEKEDLYDESQEEIFQQVVDDLVARTTPEATVVSPISDIPRFLLRTLTQNESVACEPQDWLKPFVSKDSLKMLHTQLKLTLYGILMLLANQDYEVAVERAKHLQDIADVLPEAREYYAMAKKACFKYAVALHDSFHERMAEQDFQLAFMNVTQSMQLANAVPDMDEYFKLNHQIFWDQFSKKVIQSKSLLDDDKVKKLRNIVKANPEIQGEMKREIRLLRSSVLKDLNGATDVTEACFSLMQLLQLGNAFKDATKAGQEALEVLEQRLMDGGKERDFRQLTLDMVGMGPLVTAFPELTNFVPYIIKMYKHALERSIEKKEYDVSGDIMLDLTQLGVFYPEVGRVLSRSVERLWKYFGAAVKMHEYGNAIRMVKQMSRVAHVSPSAYDKSRLGIEVIRDRLLKSIETKDYAMAQSLTQQLNKLERMLPRSMKPDEQRPKKLPEDSRNHRKQDSRQSLFSSSTEDILEDRKHTDRAKLSPDFDLTVESDTESKTSFHEDEDYRTNDSGDPFEEDLSELTMSLALRQVAADPGYPPQEINSKRRIHANKRGVKVIKEKLKTAPTAKHQSKAYQLTPYQHNDRRSSVYTSSPEGITPLPHTKKPQKHIGRGQRAHYEERRDDDEMRDAHESSRVDVDKWHHEESLNDEGWRYAMRDDSDGGRLLHKHRHRDSKAIERPRYQESRYDDGLRYSDRNSHKERRDDNSGDDSPASLEDSNEKAGYGFIEVHEKGRYHQKKMNSSKRDHHNYHHHHRHENRDLVLSEPSSRRDSSRDYNYHKKSKTTRKKIDLRLPSPPLPPRQTKIQVDHPRKQHRAPPRMTASRRLGYAREEPEEEDVLTGPMQKPTSHQSGRNSSRNRDHLHSRRYDDSEREGRHRNSSRQYSHSKETRWRGSSRGRSGQMNSDDTDASISGDEYYDRGRDTSTRHHDNQHHHNSKYRNSRSRSPPTPEDRRRSSKYSGMIEQSRSPPTPEERRTKSRKSRTATITSHGRGESRGYYGSSCRPKDRRMLAEFLSDASWE